MGRTWVTMDKLYNERKKDCNVARMVIDKQCWLLQNGIDCFIEDTSNLRDAPLRMKKMSGACNTESILPQGMKLVCVEPTYLVAPCFSRDLLVEPPL